MGDFSDLNTNHVKQRICATIVSTGFDAWYEYTERAKLLTIALVRYNDGRMKRFLCELFIQRDIVTLPEIMRGADTLTATPKKTVRRFTPLSMPFCSNETGL